MATLALSMLLSSLGTSIANIALPALTDAFSAPFHHVQWVVIAYLAALTASVVFVGRFGDIYGLRRMYLAGLGLFSIASMCCGLAPSLWTLIGARALQGVGAAFLMTLTIALVRETASEERMGRAMGLLGTVSALGTALGPSLGGLLVSVTGWRGIFLVQVPLAVLTLILAFASLPHEAGRTEERHPASLRTVRVTTLLPNLLVNLLVAAIMMTTLVVGPFYLGFGLGLRETLVGLVMSVGPMISIFSGVPSGRAVDAWGAQRVLGVGLTMLAAGAFLLSILPESFGAVGYVLAIIVLTPGYQLFQAANNTAVMADIPKDRRGLISALLSLSRNTGLILGASAMGAVFAFGVGTGDFKQASPMAVAGGMRLTFHLAGGLMLIALGVAFWPSKRDA
ncbi:MFS transporter [Acidocella sp. MX-AZ02]|uniref:MFS transporter n=1 Tax=Acidocella sp. MX-AZ02 TaxID=1214225 RepID=UPI00028CD196|nr:MFS transporter [Acidocella sp. MX-AZ02]EKM98222.1 major facilitator superfamily transporter [Acidocella sp. MX-AZ02]